MDFNFGSFTYMKPNFHSADYAQVDDKFNLNAKSNLFTVYVSEFIPLVGKSHMSSFNCAGVQITEHDNENSKHTCIFQGLWYCQ